MKKITEQNIDRFRDKAAKWDDNPVRVGVSDGIFTGLASLLPLSKEMCAAEIGAGTGLITVPLAEKVKEVAAFDLSADMLELLRQKITAYAIDNIHVHAAVFPNDDIADTAFDLIYSGMTLHHIEDVSGLLQQIYRFLRPGGYMAIADLKKEDGSFHHDNNGVCHFGFELEDITRLAQDAGFRVQTVPIVHTVRKPDATGTQREYPVFLLVAKK